MTIYLPEDIQTFREAFDETCTRILQSKEGTVFYVLFLQLIATLREHSLLKAYISELETAFFNNKQEFIKASLEAIEDAWKRLWRYHRHSLKHRKQLVAIKRLVTHPCDIRFSTLYERISFSMMEFCIFSPLFRLIETAPRLFQKAQLDIPYGPPVKYAQFLTEEELEKIPIVVKIFVPIKLNNQDKRNRLHTYINHSTLTEPIFTIKWSSEKLTSALYSQKITELETKFSIKRQSNHDKRQHLQFLAETNDVSCWERILFLYQCLNAGELFAQLKQSNGRWTKIRETAWLSASDRCDMEALVNANRSFNPNLSQSPSLFNLSVCSSINCERQIRRKDYEAYLKALQHHIHSQLYKIESTKQKAEDNPHLALPGTQKKHFVIDLVPKYWEKHPSATREEVFQDYLCKCPTNKQLKFSRWEQIIRENKLDHRPPEIKRKRGKGKKTLKN